MQYVNPLHSAHLQALYDLIASGFSKDISIETAIQLLVQDGYSEHSPITKKLNGLWCSHMYNNKSITYTQLSIYDYCPDLHNVSPEAQSLFLLMIRLQDQESGYVAVKKAMFAQALHFGEKRSRHMQEYLNELCSINVITTVTEQRRGSKLPQVYKINLHLSKIGKSFRPLPICSNKSAFCRSLEQIPYRGTDGTVKKILAGTLAEVAETDKENGDAKGTADADSPEHDQSPASDDSINYNNNKNNNTNINNMQNNTIDSALTQEEEKLFETETEANTN